MIRKLAAIALICSMVLVVPATKAFAFAPDEGDVNVCLTIEGQDLGCNTIQGLGVNGPGELTPNQLMLIWYFVIAAWALNEEILESGWSIEIVLFFGPVCQNCNDGYKPGRIVTDPLPSLAPAY